MPETPSNREALLLATKLYIPPLRPTWVARAHLIERLDAATKHRVTLVAAPPGFGKTTLLTQWIHGCPSPIAWLSLDAAENEPARFWSYLIAALGTVRPGFGEDLQAALHLPTPPAMESFLIALINATAAFPNDVVLVLDDYHVIDAPPIHEALAFLVEHLPPRVHLVICTRADPPLPLARWRARGELLELRAADLSFCYEHTAAFLNEVMRLNLTEQEISALERRIEGWIAGLQLASLALRGHVDAAGFIARFTGGHRFILTYLVDEVLRQQPDDVQSFLLHTSILDRLSASLCDAVTGRDDSRAILKQVDRAGLFTFPLDDEGDWYRYHQLFADVLRLRLQHTQAGEMPGLHRRAAEWYEHAGLVNEAMGHWLAAFDGDRAARLVEQNARSLLGRGEVSLLAGWLQALPDELIHTRPRLGIVQARTLLIGGQWDRLEPCLDQAERAVRAVPCALTPPEVGEVVGTVAAIRAMLAANRGDAPAALGLSQQALQHLPLEDVAMRSVVGLSLGDAHSIDGNLAAASEAYGSASALARSANHLQAALIALYERAKVQVIQGQLGQARATCEEALRHGTQAGGPRIPALAAPAIFIAGLLREWNQLQDAERSLREAMELCRCWGHTEMLADCYAARAWLLQSQGDLDGALSSIAQADRLVHTHSLKLLTNSEVAAARARLWLIQGNLAPVTAWVRESGLSLEVVQPYRYELEQIVIVRWLLACDQGDRALQLAARLLDSARAGRRFGRAVELLVLQALAWQAQGRIERALVSLARALTLAEPEGYMRLFLDEGAPMHALLRLIQNQGSGPAPDVRYSNDYVRRLLAAFDLEGFGLTCEGRATASDRLKPFRAPAGASARQSSGLAASATTLSSDQLLSQRELQVLRLIASGASTREIAEELVVAVSTVKRHINNIFGKLDVHSRTQLLARARELGLLP